MKNATPRLLILALCAALSSRHATVAEVPATPPTPAPLRALIVGGGPDTESNQVAIESNVRYVSSLLGSAPRLTLFADGKPAGATVLYQKPSDDSNLGNHAVDLMVNGADAMFRANEEALRAPRLGKKLDGGANSKDIARAFSTLAAQQKSAPRSLLIYFTGHGGDNQSDLDDNFYAQWGGGDFSVRKMAAQLKKIPDTAPVAVVMVQCFSGAFANLLFEDGDPQARVLARDFAGFFASTRDRPAAGCTSEVNEAEYHDFTSYFFAALSGRDRAARRVANADFNADGRVGMNEAFCYALANDASIDVPVCTSDAFLRRFVKTPDAQTFASEYSQLLQWASPAQRAALEAISVRLKLSGVNRLKAAYDAARTAEAASHAPDENRAFSTPMRGALAAFEKQRTAARKLLMAKFPAVNAQDAKKRDAQRAAALLWAQAEAKRGAWKPLLQSGAKLRALWLAQQKRETENEVADAYRLRFIRLAKSVALAHDFQSEKDAALQARYTRLVEAEARSLPLK